VQFRLFFRVASTVREFNTIDFDRLVEQAAQPYAA
jgi:hypothetical protein